MQKHTAFASHSSPYAATRLCTFAYSPIATFPTMSLRIGLLGYGKMGRAIDALAARQDVQIVWRIGRAERPQLDGALLRQADVVIEFSRPEAAWENVGACLEQGVPVVSGTTGWLDQLPQARQLCQEKNGALLWASNFSIGVNLFFALNRYLAVLMQSRPEYGAAVTEIHHIHKLDAPSGTALTLVHDLMAEVERITEYTLQPPLFTLALPPSTLPITAIREGEVPGTHLIRWSSEVDDITIEHRAHSRTGFAAGALLAARWLADKRGVFSMADVLGLGSAGH